MADTNQQSTSALSLEDPSAPPRPTELEMLKQRAAAMGIRHSNNIGVPALRAKIEAKMAGEADNTDEEGNPIEAPQPASTQAPQAPAQPNALEMGAARITDEQETVRTHLALEDAPVRVMSIREYMLKSEMRLHRCRITNLDPKKKDLPGEIITVANEFLGTVRKFIPYGEATDEGYHIPHCLYTFLKDRRFLNIQLKKDRRTGTNEVSSRYVPEFSIEILEPLTERELRDLATAQLAIGSVGDELN